MCGAEPATGGIGRRESLRVGREVLLSFVTARGGYAAAAQCASFDHFVRDVLPSVARAAGQFTTVLHGVTFTVALQDVRVGPPAYTESDGNMHSLTPDAARLRNLVYAAPLHATLRKCSSVPAGGGVPASEWRGEQRVLLGMLPVLVGSALCRSASPAIAGDGQGFFVINGTERVLQMHERLAHGTIHVSQGPGTRPLLMAEMRSTPDGQGYRMPVVMCMTCAIEAGGLTLRVAFGTRSARMGSAAAHAQSLPLVVLMRALGAVSDRAVLESIFGAGAVHCEAVAALLPTLEDASSAPDQATAMAVLEARLACGRRSAADVMARDLFPHVAADRADATAAKVALLGRMAHALFASALLGAPLTDRDNYSIKRVELCGEALAMLVRQIIVKQMAESRSVLHRTYDDALAGAEVPRAPAFDITGVSPQTMNKAAVRAVGGGMWTVLIPGSTIHRPARRSAVPPNVLNRLTPPALASSVQQVRVPATNAIALRTQSPSATGAICPVETPESQMVGLVKHLAVSAVVSLGWVDTAPVRSILQTLGMGAVGSGAPVHLNGAPVGGCAEPRALATALRALRRGGDLAADVGIAVLPLPPGHAHSHELAISVDNGRILRPLFIVPEDRSAAALGAMLAAVRAAPSAESLFELGLVELLDASEHTNAHIVMTLADAAAWQPGPGDAQPPSHAELHPAAVLGGSAGIIPFSNHNQSPRNAYWAAMGKQALGPPPAAERLRMETMAMHLLAPEPCLVGTMGSELPAFDTERPWRPLPPVVCYGCGRPPGEGPPQPGARLCCRMQYVAREAPAALRPI